LFCILFWIFCIFYIFCIFLKFHINFISLLPKRSQVPSEHQKQKNLTFCDSMTRIHEPWCTSWHTIVKTRTQDLILRSLTLYQLEQLSYDKWWKIYFLYHNIHIMHIVHINNIFCILQSSIFCIFYIFCVKILTPAFHSLLTLLLGSPSQGPAIYVPPPTSITTVCWSVARCSGKVCWFSSHGKGYCPSCTHQD